MMSLSHPLQRFSCQLSRSATNNVTGGRRHPDHEVVICHLRLGVVPVNVVGSDGSTLGEAIKQLEGWSSSSHDCGASSGCFRAVGLEHHHVVSVGGQVLEGDPVLGVVPGEGVLVPGNIPLNCVGNSVTVSSSHLRSSHGLEGAGDSLEDPEVDEIPGGGLVQGVLPLLEGLWVIIPIAGELGESRCHGSQEKYAIHAH